MSKNDGGNKRSSQDVWSRSGRIVGDEVQNYHVAELQERIEDYLVSSHSHWLANLRSFPPRRHQGKCNAFKRFGRVNQNRSKAELTLKSKSITISDSSYTFFFLHSAGFFFMYYLSSLGYVSVGMNY